MIYPKCKNIIKDSSGNAMGVRYDGYVIPCCFFGIEFPFDELKELLGDDIKNIHLKSGKTLDEINKSKEFQRIEETWNTNIPLRTCVAACSDPEHVGTTDKTSTGADTVRKDINKSIGE